ncbi:transcriptional regulator [Candidatus Bathyarchaeota archaeon]|nr:MAG: transcriptional regulator [Candidatus Bathyarchaeota archaeon]
MLIPCEIAVKSVVPAIRCAIAKQLIQTYGLKQKEVANLLGITQTAVSKYTRHVRGRVLKIEDVTEVQPVIIEIAASLANGHISRRELVERFCVACAIIRRNGLMCKLCKRSDQSIDIEQCDICSSGFSFCKTGRT